MSKEAAKRFAEAYGRDGAIERAVRALPEESRGSLEAIARTAQGLGYDVAPNELADAFEGMRAAAFAALEGAELSDEELEQVSGGGSAYDCYSDYNPNDWCWFNDRCLTANIYYRANPECQQTYEPDENCLTNDNCNKVLNLNYPTNPNRDSGSRVF